MRRVSRAVTRLNADMQHVFVCHDFTCSLFLDIYRIIYIVYYIVIYHIIIQYSTVQYSTVQYDVKNVTEGREEGKGRRGPGSVFY